MSDEEAEAARQELLLLKVEHQDLDAAIAAMNVQGIGDQIQTQRLKKRKLQLKDRIYQLEDMLYPDIIA
ncbi:YdcH family protein [Amorphus sp. MBR-141]